MCEINWEYVIAILTILGSTTVMIVNLVINKRQRTADIVTKNRMDWIQRLRIISQEYYKRVKLFHDKQLPNDKSKFLEELYLNEAEIKLQLNCFGRYDAEIISYVEEINKSYDAFIHKIIIDESSVENPIESSMKMIEYLFKYNPDLLFKTFEKFIEKNKLDEISKDKSLNEMKELLNNPDVQKKIMKSLIIMEDKYIKECCKILTYLPELVLIYLQIYLKVEWERVKEESKKGNIKDFEFDDNFNTHLIKKKNEIEVLKEQLPSRLFSSKK